MKAFRRWYGNLRFRNKIMLTSLAISLVPFLLFAFVIGGVLISQGQSTALQHTEQITRQVRDSIDTYIGSIERTADYINEEIMNMEGGMGLSLPSAQLRIGRMFENISATHPEIAGIMVVSYTDEFVGKDLSRLSRDALTGEGWYLKAQAVPGQMVLISSVAGRNIGADTGHSVDDVFSLAKALTYPGTDHVWGVLLIDVHHDILLESVRQVTIGEKGFVYIVDETGNVVYTSSVNEVVYRIPPTLLPEASASQNLRVQGQRYQLQVEASDYTGWRTVGVFSLDETMGSVYAVLLVLGISVLLTGILVFVVCIMLANTVTGPVSRLQGLMREAEKGKLAVRFNSQYNDEIGDLGRSFNHMLGRIQGLIDRVYEEQKHKRDAEMKILQEQIKPHFLYNTLDSISWMAREHEAEDIVRLVDALTNMFRVGLSRGKDSITMREELAHVSNYLYIQKIRYQDKLHYSIEAEAAVEDIVVPKLILQPLVENAIYHGIKEKRGEGRIWVECSLADGAKTLRLCVRDNGAGMPPEALELLRARLALEAGEDSKAGFGLFYIEERIRMAYGDAGTIEVASTQGVGTSITLTLPAHSATGEQPKGE